MCFWAQKLSLQSAAVLFHDALNVNFSLWYLYCGVYVALCQHQQKAKIKHKIPAHSDNSFEGLEKQNISKQTTISLDTMKYLCEFVD